VVKKSIRPKESI